MLGFFKTIAGLLVYKEPKNKELGFELLEDESEDLDSSSQKHASPQNKKYTNAENANEKNLQKNSRKNNDSFETKNTENEGTKAGNKSSSQLEVPAKEKYEESTKPVKKPLSVKDWNDSKDTDNDPASGSCNPPENPEFLSYSLCDNLITIRRKFDMPKNQDILIRNFKIGRKVKAFMVYIDGMVDKSTLNLSVYPQLMSKDLAQEIGDNYLIDYLIENVLTVHNLTKANRFTDIINKVLGGVSALFIEGCSESILIETRGYEKRPIGNPVTETVVKGPQEGFTENLRTNLTLVRRIIKNEKLITEMMTLGKLDNSNCAVLYLDGVANPNVVKEVKKRLKMINSDFIPGDGIIEQFIEDNNFMLFPQVLTTERPDRTASFIMEGQVVVITEGTPFSIAVPVTFFRLFHTSEDSFIRWPLGNFLRFIRLVGLFCATLLPGIYVAVVLFHPEMIPTELLTATSKAKETVPFPTLFEVILMEFSFELIREGGIRVPTVIGQTLGIVGALILGQAAVSAGLVSPVVVIVVSITALGSFVIPNYTLSMAIRVERFIFIFISSALGFYGLALALFLLAIIVCSMKSFGQPFFTPIAPKVKPNPDVIFRGPAWSQTMRPDALNTGRRAKAEKNKMLWLSQKKTHGKGGVRK